MVDVIGNIELGDWVCAEITEGRLTPPMRVVGISSDTAYLVIHDEQGDPFEYAFDELRPVPLTNEIIKTNNLCAYIQDSKRTYVLETYGQLEVIIRFGGTIMCKCIVRYVHELQHLMRIYGIRKEINL